jgi:CubicO group peptidase (beta-lactamase class C family)
MAARSIPGVALALIDGDDERSATFGVAGLEAPRPVDADTLFPIASITKTLVATAAMRLVERGLLDLDRPVRAYLPDLRLADPATTDLLTTAHLLTHTGGFQGDFEEGWYGLTCGAGDDALARFVPMLAQLPQRARPGELWFYNNAGFVLAGRLLEALTGLTFQAAIAELVLAPLGMAASSFSAGQPRGDEVAHGHKVVAGRPEPRRSNPPRVYDPAGGLLCPAADLLGYARFQLGDGAVAGGQRLLAPASMASMRVPRVGDALHNGCLASFGDEVGLSWFSRATAAGRLLVHGGWTSLAHRLTLLPERRFALAVLTNADTGAQLHAEVTKLALRAYHGVDGLDATPLPAPPTDPAEHAGTYRFADPDDEDVAVRVDGGRLRLDLCGPAAFYAPDRIVALEGVWAHERGQFLRRPDGRIWALRMGGGLGIRQA